MTDRDAPQSETSTLIWLDARVNSDEDNKQAQDELRSIIRSFHTFDNVKQCEEYIRTFSPRYRIVLIVSGQFGREIVPKIHGLEQLLSVYVYCMNKEANEQWAKGFSKVRAVVVTLKDLIEEIRFNQRSRRNFEEPITINVFSATDNPDQSTTDLNGDFLHSLLLIDALLRLKPIENEEQQFIQFCTEDYEKSKPKVGNADKFQGPYSSERAVWWYTIESDLHKDLNKALRVQNIDRLVFFRFFIRDIYEQLKQNQYNKSATLYRGQLMASHELEKIRNSMGQLISASSFFSTSRYLDVAQRFLKEQTTSDPDIHRVLFQITADPSVATPKPFADISSFSEFSDEGEILFMIASIFRLETITQNKEETWIIEMTLCGDDVHDLKELYEHMKKEYWGDEKEIDFLSFSGVLYHMGKYTEATKIYQRLLKELSPKNPSCSKLYYYLGMIAFKQEKYDLSLSWYRKSLDVLNGNPTPNSINIGEMYNCIGEVYRVKHDFHQALEQYEKSIEYFKKADAENHPTMANIYNNIGLIYQEEKKYPEALEYYEKSLAINKNLPNNHADTARSYHSIAILYDYLHDFARAMEYHEKSLNIKSKVYTSYHPTIADSYQCMGCLHYGKHEWQKALDCFQKAADIYRRAFSAEHPKVERIETNIKRVKAKLK